MVNRSIKFSAKSDIMLIFYTFTVLKKNSLFLIGVLWRLWTTEDTYIHAIMFPVVWLGWVEYHSEESKQHRITVLVSSVFF